MGTSADVADHLEHVSTEGISNTINLNSTTLMLVRARFAREIEPVFAVNTMLTRTHASVIQDASIRVFYALVAEAMGSAYADFAKQTVLTPIPSSNGVAVLWLSGVQEYRPPLGKVQQNMRNINLRESPYAISLGDCQGSASALILGDFTVLAYPVAHTPLRCRYCKPGIEFRSILTLQCESCTLVSTLNCDSGVATNACTADRDAHCVSTAQTVPVTFCNNKFLDFGEQCDASAANTATAACCTDSSCMLLEGYYVDPPCSTICGDGIQAGTEECDDLDDLRCDMAICAIRSDAA
jgi:hypothetical protein